MTKPTTTVPQRMPGMSGEKAASRSAGS